MGMFPLKILFLSVLFVLKVQAQEVVCLHGFLGSSLQMGLLEKELTKEGFEVLNWGYPSRDLCIQEHGALLVKDLVRLAEQKPEEPIHFVTHSMGALVLLAALNHPKCPLEAKKGRLVLIAPPIQGSCWARRLGRSKIVSLITKEYSGRELTSLNQFSHFGSYPSSLEGVLVIAGFSNINPFLKGSNDGTVLVEETHPAVPHQHVVVKGEHALLVFKKEVIKLTTNFLITNRENANEKDRK